MDHTLLRLLNRRFKISSADTGDDLRVAHRLRYEVYRIQNEYEDRDQSDHLKTDEFDCHAVHGLLRCQSTLTALGTVRLVLPLDKNLDNSFAFQRLLESSTRRAFNKLPLWTMGEVSHFCISPQWRHVTGSSDVTAQVGATDRAAPLIRLGLIQALIRLSVQNGISYWCAAMEPMLLVMLAAMAIRFCPVGPMVDYYGRRRQPCYCSVGDILDAVKRERPAFWSVFTDGGRLLVPKEW